MKKIAIWLLGFLPSKSRVFIGKKIYSAYRFSESRVSNSVRCLALELMGARVGCRVKISRDVSFDYVGNLQIGNNVSIQEKCFLSAYGGITIGNNVSIGRGCSFFSSEHDYANGEIIRNNQIIKKKLDIGNNIWIGANCTVLGGVTINDRVVVGAMSLVNKNVLSNNVVVGVPAKKIKGF